jgi:hypothetical protein
MPSTPRTGPIALSPERPEAVLAWAEDLETAMARLPRREGTGSKEDGTQEDGTGGGSPSGTDNSQDRGASPQGAGSGSATRPGDDRDGTEGDQG